MPRRPSSSPARTRRVGLLDTVLQYSSDERVFHNTEPGHSKFWAISRRETSVTVRFGKIGSAGQTKVHAADDSRAEAVRHMEELIIEKTTKGAYVEIVPQTPLRKLTAEEVSVLDSPRFTMREEFERPIGWTDWRGQRYELQTEWWYVNGTAARRDGTTPGTTRDVNNEGMSPSDFMARANAFIA